MTALFAIAVFWGAAMLFVVQPLAARLLLPVLGGSPAVWIASMLFFQSALLAGYGLAHALARIRHGAGVAVYAAGLAAAALALPIGVVNWPTPAAGFEAFWVLGALAWMVGPAFVALAAAGPMLQSWYARAHDHAGGGPPREPYALFAASNAGSLIGLLAYPFLVEPTLGLRVQGVWWGVGYGAFVLLALSCGLVSWRAGRSAAVDAAPRANAERSRRAAGPGVWLLWSFAGSSLLLGTTLKMTTDIASVPLLWVAPLSVYLLTFVVAFRPGLRAGWVSRRGPMALALSVTALAVVTLIDARDPARAVYAVYACVLATGAYLCHARLSSARPEPARLTAYYLCIAAGGSLGGVFNALAAPELFDGIGEYPIAVALACAAMGRRTPKTDRPERRPHAGTRLGSVMLVAGLFGVGVALARSRLTGVAADAVGVGLPALALYALRRDGRLMGGAFVGLAFAAFATPTTSGTERFRERTFFGVTRIVEDTDAGRVALLHGATEHGAEITRDGLAGQPTSYYHPRGPAGDVLGAVFEREAPASIALVGLGAGSLAAYADAGDRVDIYEIDPLVVRVAEDPRWFSFLTEAAARGVVGRTVVGDGRLGLTRAIDAGEVPEGGYDVIVLDAFTSDAIPPHLLTAEAFEVYGRALAPGGVVLAHVSNRYLDLQPVVLGASSELGLSAAARWHAGVSEALRAEGARPSRWVAVARTPEPLALLPVATWIRLDPERDRRRLWTDDHADLLSVLDLGP